MLECRGHILSPALHGQIRPGTGSSLTFYEDDIWSFFLKFFNILLFQDDVKLVHLKDLKLNPSPKAFQLTFFSWLRVSKVAHAQS
jgi:hypothetical protein